MSLLHHRLGPSRVCLLLLCALAAPAAAQDSANGWRLVFAVDSTGRPVSGSKSRLLDAVRAGHPVRVGWGLSLRQPDGSAGGLEHVAPAAFLSIHRGEVFAQLAPILGQVPSAREPAIAFRTGEAAAGDQLWYALLDTTGRLVGYFSGTPGSTAQRTVRVPTYWYVQGEPSEPVAPLYQQPRP